MRTTGAAGLACALSLTLALGCTSSKTPATDDGSAGSGSESLALSVSVSPTARTFVELSTPSIVSVEGTGDASIAWDIALEGRDVFTNGGISGPGNSSAFGPLSAPTFLSDTAPEVPLTLKDRAGGALIDWYKYAGATHQLFSRYHVYGITDGDRFFKLQILGYYGEQLGAPVSALYHVRYAEVTADGSLETHDVAGIDATAGGSIANDQEPSGCLDLDSEKVTALTPAEAGKSDAWQLCFRREGVAVNGGLSGPRSMRAVDLQGAATADETEAEIEKRSDVSEQKPFDDVDMTVLGDPTLAYRADGVVTAFGQRWLEPASKPLAVSDAVWLVIGANGASKYLLEFSDLAGDPSREEASLSLEAKSVR